MLFRSDNLEKKFSQNQFDWLLKDESGNAILTEEGDYIVMESAPVISGSDNDWIQQESDQFVDWSTVDPFSERNI